MLNSTYFYVFAYIKNIFSYAIINNLIFLISEMPVLICIRHIKALFYI